MQVQNNVQLLQFYYVSKRQVFIHLTCESFIEFNFYSPAVVIEIKRVSGKSQDIFRKRKTIEK